MHLITGASGFIGGHLEALVAAGRPVRCPRPARQPDGAPAGAELPMASWLGAKASGGS
jgi:nucleoside-diphosphate-sugar epimerase